MKRLECAKYIVKLREASKRPFLLVPCRKHTPSSKGSRRKMTESKITPDNAISLLDLNVQDTLQEDSNVQTTLNNELESEAMCNSEENSNNNNDPPTVYDLALQCHSD